MTEIDFNSKQDAVEAHLKYKIDKKLDKLADLGLMTVDQVSADVLLDLYPLEDVEAAILSAVKSGHMDLYYLIECDSCGYESIFLEEDYASQQTFTELCSDGLRCQKCGKRIYGVPGSIVKRYAISNFKLEKPDEEEWDDSTFSRLLRWFGVKRSRKSKNKF